MRFLLSVLLLLTLCGGVFGGAPPSPLFWIPDGTEKITPIPAFDTVRVPVIVWAGKIKVDDSIQIGNYWQTAANGTDGWVLTTNGAGWARWLSAPGAGGGSVDSFYVIFTDSASAANGNKHVNGFVTPNDTLYVDTGGAGETNTLGDTGTFNETEGFGLAGGKTGTVLKVKGLIEGSDITIAKSGDSGLIITASAGGWADDGDVVRLTTSTDSVGIGTSSPAYKLDVAGGIHSNVGFYATSAYFQNINKQGPANVNIMDTSTFLAGKTFLGSFYPSYNSDSLLATLNHIRKIAHDTADVVRGEMSSDADSLVGIDIQAKTGNLQNNYILKVDISGADTSLHWEADASGAATLEDVFNYMHPDIFDTTGFNDSIGIKTNGITDGMVTNALTVTGYMQDEDINTFDELQSWVSGKTLLNEEDAATIDVGWTFAGLLAADSTNTDHLVSSNVYLGNDTLKGVDVLVTDTVVVDGDVIKDFTGTNLSVTAGVLNASGAGLTYWTEADDNDTSVFTATGPNTTVGLNDNLTMQGNDITGIGNLTVVTGITVPNNSISDEELDEGANFTWTGEHYFQTHTYLYDGVGDSPNLIFKDNDAYMLTINKDNDGFSYFFNNEGAHRFYTSADADDYIYFDTFAANVPMISTGGACDLVINASSGEISFDTANLTTTGTLDVGATSVTGNITVTGTVDGVDVAALNTDLAADSGSWNATADALGTTITSTKITNGTIEPVDLNQGSKFNFNVDAFHKDTTAADSAYMSKKYIDDAAGGLTDQSVKGDHVDSTAEDFVFDDPYKGTSAVGDSVLTTRKELGDTSAAVRGDFPTGLTDQGVKGDHVDSTGENFVFDNAYEGTSAEADSQYSTHNWVQVEIEDSLNEYSLTSGVRVIAHDTADVLRAEMDDSAAAHAGDTANAVRSEFPTPKYMFTLADPDALYATDHEWSIDPLTERAITIDSFRVTLDADPTTELTFSLKFADAFIGFANATVIDDTATVAGVTVVTGGFGDATVPANKCIYLLFDADPDDAITQASFKVYYTFD